MCRFAAQQTRVRFIGAPPCTKAGSGAQGIPAFSFPLRGKGKGNFQSKKYQSVFTAMYYALIRIISV